MPSFARCAQCFARTRVCTGNARADLLSAGLNTDGTRRNNAGLVSRNCRSQRLKRSNDTAAHEHRTTARTTAQHHARCARTGQWKRVARAKNGSCQARPDNRAALTIELVVLPHWQPPVRKRKEKVGRFQNNILYHEKCRNCKCSPPDSNREHPGPQPGASASWAKRAKRR